MGNLRAIVSDLGRADDDEYHCRRISVPETKDLEMNNEKKIPIFFVQHDNEICWNSNLQHLIGAGFDTGDQMVGSKRGLLDIGKVIGRISIQHNFTDG